MACCGASKNVENPEKILKDLRKDDEKIVLKLNNLKLEFDQKESKWNCNVNN